jgi:hypothetical protein
MKRLVWRLAPEVVLGWFLLNAGGCDPSHDVKPGPPELQSFSVIDNATGSELDIGGDAGLIAVPGFVHLTALFDRLLDPTTVTSLDGGVDFGADVDTIAVTPALPAGVSVTYTSIYTPNGGPKTIAPAVPDGGPAIPGGLYYGPGPSITTTADPTFPSGATITATLDKSKVRSKKGEPFAGDAQITFQTLPFAASIAVPMGDADPDAGADAGAPLVKPEMQAVTIAFTNLPGAKIADHITVTAGGVAFADVTVATAQTSVTITPNTAWPAGSTIEVTVDATAADALGATTGTAMSGSFTTGSN